MRHKVYAMDTSFYHSLGSYHFDARCEMLSDLGYDATYLTLWHEPDAWREPAWSDLVRLGSVQERFGLSVAAVYVSLDIALTDRLPENARVLRLLETLEGCKTVELALTCSTMASSDPRGDAFALPWLARLLAVAEARGITLALYPHVSYWLERIEDAVRLCQAVKHPLLRAVFCGFHWYAVDGKSLPSGLERAAPYLAHANLCGSRRLPAERGMPATIEPLDEGELDNFAVLGALGRTGFSGMLGVQGYSVGGDVYTILRRSLMALRDMERRLEAHPSWANLRTP
jgi:sugar phosphate isomerase/epimerase